MKEFSRPRREEKNNAMEQEANMLEFTQSKSFRGVIGEVLGQRWYRAAFLASSFTYWLLYSFSSGLFTYYSFDLAPLLKSASVPNPNFFVYTQSLTDFYDSGMVWYPTNHFQVNLLFGPTAFSLILSGLFGLNIALFAFGLRRDAFRRRNGSIGPTGSFSSLLGLLPALFSGGCCSVPFGVLLLGSFLPSAGLSVFVYSYPWLTNAVAATAMLVSVLYISKRNTNCCSCGRPAG
jgi:hypothetical protein